jgi:hypothetical protein
MNKGAVAAAIVLLSSGMLCAQGQSGQTQNQPASKQNQVPPAAQSGQPSQQQQKTQPVTGKTGNEATHIDVTTTGSAGQETPGVQTNLGAEQQPGKHPEIKDSKASKPNQRPRPGAPPNWEQVGQDPGSAATGAAAAKRAEIGGSGGDTLGVDAMPQSDQTSEAQRGTSSSKASDSKAKVKTKKSHKARRQSQQTQPPQ